MKALLKIFILCSTILPMAQLPATDRDAVDSLKLELINVKSDAGRVNLLLQVGDNVGARDRDPMWAYVNLPMLKPLADKYLSNLLTNAFYPTQKKSETTPPLGLGVQFKSMIELSTAVRDSSVEVFTSFSSYYQIKIIYEGQKDSSRIFFMDHLA